ncbi:MAG: hypothetical protein AAB403_16050 [Planctomycetota bacterium]
MLVVGGGLVFGKVLGVPEKWQLDAAEAIGMTFSALGKDLKTLRFEVDAMGGLVGLITAKLSVHDLDRPTAISLVAVLVADYVMLIFATAPVNLQRFEFALSEKDLVEGFVQFMTTSRTLMLGLLVGVLSKTRQ